MLPTESELLVMTADCRREGHVLVVRQAKLLCAPPHDVRQSRVVHMADRWEEVVFNLMLEASANEVSEPALGREVGRGAELMRCPVVFHGFGFRRSWERCQRDDVCKLKDERKCSAANEAGRQVADADQGEKRQRYDDGIQHYRPNRMMASAVTHMPLIREAAT